MNCSEKTLASSRGRLSSKSPAFVAAVLGILTGLGLMGFAVYLIGTAETPLTLDLALIVVGLIECVASFYTLQRVRVAWSFALSINGTVFAVLLFSAPRIRDAADVSIVVALIPSLIFGALVLLHSLQTDDF